MKPFEYEGTEFVLPIIRNPDFDQYIHYGSNMFHPSWMNDMPVVNDPAMVKPLNGLWAVAARNEYREDNDDTWRELVKTFPEPTNTEDSFGFHLTPSANILVIDTEEDLKRIPDCMKINPEDYDEMIADYYIRYSKFSTFLDYEKLQEIGIDGVYIMMNSFTCNQFYTWDITSLLVMNPKVVKTAARDTFKLTQRLYDYMHDERIPICERYEKFFYKYIGKNLSERKIDFYYDLYRTDVISSELHENNIFHYNVKRKEPIAINL